MPEQGGASVVGSLRLAALSDKRVMAGMEEAATGWKGLPSGAASAQPSATGDLADVDNRSQRWDSLL